MASRLPRCERAASRSSGQRWSPILRADRGVGLGRRTGGGVSRPQSLLATSPRPLGRVGQTPMLPEASATAPVAPPGAARQETSRDAWVECLAGYRPSVLVELTRDLGHRMRSESFGPAASGSDRCSSSAELSRQGSLMHAELSRHERERRALFVPCGRHGNRFVGHLADDAPSRDAGSVEVVDDGGPVNFVETGESVDRRTSSVVVDQLCDLGSGQPSLHRV